MFKMSRPLLATALCFGLLAGTAHAQNTELKFEEPWLRASVPGQKHGAGYVTIHNSSDQPLELSKVQSDRAERVELHTVIREDGLAKMREIQSIPVPANGDVKLQPGGYHIMFINLTKPFEVGETVPLELQFGDETPIAVEFAVQPATHHKSSGGMDHHHKH